MGYREFAVFGFGVVLEDADDFDSSFLDDEPDLEFHPVSGSGCTEMEHGIFILETLNVADDESYGMIEPKRLYVDSMTNRLNEIVNRYGWKVKDGPGWILGHYNL